MCLHHRPGDRRNCFCGVCVFSGSGLVQLWTSRHSSWVFLKLTQRSFWAVFIEACCVLGLVRDWPCRGERMKWSAVQGGRDTDWPSWLRCAVRAEPKCSQQLWLHFGPEVESWLSHSVNVSLSVSVSTVTHLLVTFYGPVTLSAEHTELHGHRVLFSDSSHSSMEGGLKKNTAVIW